MKHKITLIILFFAFTIVGYGQTALVAGEITITGFNSDNPDQFTFVLLTDVTTNTTINFTDRGWFAAGGFRANEGTITWTATSALSCGTEITITDNSPFITSSGTVTDSSMFQLSASGDQILAYQGADATPTFIYAVNFDGAGWSDAIDPNTSAIPTGLLNGTNAVDFGEIDNANYNCAVTIDSALILLAVSTNTNWALSNLTRLSLGGCGYTCMACASSTTWTAGAWDNGAPDLTTSAIINANYNTTANGSFNACSLTVNATFRLTVDNLTYVEVENDVVVNGELYVETQGAFVQRGDAAAAGTYTNNGISTVFKTTAIFDSNISIYNYTYWSSPVTNANVITTFPNPIDNRRYYFQAENYLDATAETGNNNATVDDQDDIDDNGNDWQFATTTMDVGRGYAVTAVSGPPMPGLYSDSADFIGEFNTGDVLVSVYKNDFEALDNNWNLIGNPYPSAIDAQAFLTENTLIAANPTAPMNGAIFLWSQGAAADAGANGNEAFNFSQDDYAIINGLMGTAGGSGDIPNPYIPSGQGFFISYDHAASAIDFSVNSDGHTISRNEVRFTNSMRVTGNNGQFFRVVLPNKIWLNLTSDNGIFSQIGLGYVSGATNGYDGMYYDTPRNLSLSTNSIIYSLIDDEDVKFSIQGKEPSSLNLEEIIPLGFDTSIDVATLYTLSIAQFEGDFFSNNTVYLKDNLLTILHDLSLNDYTFTSEVGEFNNRFEIVFNQEALSLGNQEISNNDLSIIELQNGNVQFKLSSSLELKSIEIIDLLGRTLYRLEANGNSKTYSLSNLSQATYIAKVELSNGVVITKKAVKRF